MKIVTATEMLGARIRELRKRRGLTQEQLAEKLGVDQKHMSKIELGKSYPSLDRLILISESLGVSLPDLFEFMHTTSKEDRSQKIEEMLLLLNEKDQRRIFKIVKTFLEG
jgi:transcriptional regulator with XRE-family HTH domain